MRREGTVVPAVPRGRRAVLCLVVCLLSIAALARAVCGDVNGDGIVNIGDALLVAQYDVGLRAALPEPDNCDVNLDGACNIGDALRIAQCDVGFIDCASFPTSAVTGKCAPTTTTTTSTTSTTSSTSTSTSTSTSSSTMTSSTTSSTTSTTSTSSTSTSTSSSTTTSTRPTTTTTSSTTTTTTTTSSTTTSTTLPLLNLSFNVLPCDCTAPTPTCSLVVTWDNANVSIKLEHSIDNAVTWTTILSASVVGALPSFTDTGLPPGATVYYRYTILGSTQSATYMLEPIFSTPI